MKKTAHESPSSACLTVCQTGLDALDPSPLEHGTAAEALSFQQGRLKVQHTHDGVSRATEALATALLVDKVITAEEWNRVRQLPLREWNWRAPEIELTTDSGLRLLQTWSQLNSLQQLTRRLQWMDSQAVEAVPGTQSPERWTPRDRTARQHPFEEVHVAIMRPWFHDIRESYVVGAYQRSSLAHEAAENEANDRGGKYEGETISIPVLPDSSDEFMEGYPGLDAGGSTINDTARNSIDKLTRHISLASIEERNRAFKALSRSESQLSSTLATISRLAIQGRIDEETERLLYRASENQSLQWDWLRTLSYMGHSVHDLQLDEQGNWKVILRLDKHEIGIPVSELNNQSPPDIRSSVERAITEAQREVQVEE